MRMALLVLVLAGLLAAAYWAAPTARKPDPAPPPARPPAPPSPEWAGSAACRECHPDIHARWSRTAHALTIRDFAPDVVAKPFDGEVFAARGIDHRLGPGATMRAEGPGGEKRTFDVDWVIGLRRVQMFTTRMPGGRIQVLPVFLEVPEERWFDYTDFIFGVPDDLVVPPDSAYSWYGPHRNYNSRCGRCHMTNYEIGYDPAADTYATTWSERVVACESCHGAAGGHVDHWRREETGPDPIVNPAKLPVDRANGVCGQCHAEGLMVQPGFVPGDDVFAHFELAGLEDDKHLFPDGRARELIHNLVPTLESRCGPIACTKCHDPHGRGAPGDLYKPLDDDWQCTQCHEDTEPHTHHAPESAGSRCVNCHMPRLVIEGGHGRVFDHTISIPSIRNTRELGLPNACRSCHVEEYPGWEYAHFERWYPGADTRNHRVALAAAVAAGRARTPGARELLRPYLEDENPVYRAGAAHLLTPLGADLRAQLDDPHPFVRLAAVHAVARSHPERVEPLLDSGNAVLKRAAAMALATRPENGRNYDYAKNRPALLARVIAALEDLRRMRPDDPDLVYVLDVLR